MRLLSHSRRDDGECLMGWEESWSNQKESLRNQWIGLSLQVLDDYLKGATYGTSGADVFTLGAPTALFCFNNGYNVINYLQDAATAHDDT